MRFRYFDGEGLEVEISSVDALAFRIRTGIITPETLLYDSAVDEWGPAGEHPVFRFVKEEGEGPWSPSEITAPPRKPGGASKPGAQPGSKTRSGARSEPGAGPKPDGGTEAAPPPRPGTGRAPSDAAPRRPPAPGRAPPPDDAARTPPPRARRRPGRAPPLDPPRESAAKGTGADAPAGADARGRANAAPEGEAGGAPKGPSGPAGEKAPKKKTPEPELSDLGGAVLEGLTSTFQDTISELPAESPPARPPPPRKSPERPEGSPWAEMMPQPRRATRPAMRAPRRLRKRRARRLRAGGRWGIRWYVVVLALLPVGAVVVLTMGEANVRAARDALAGAVGIVAGGNAQVAGEAEAEAGGESGIRSAALTAEPAEVEAADAAPSAEPDATATGRALPEDLPSVEELTAAVHRDLAGALDNLQASLGVPEAPPPEWLHGVYLAQAGDFPEVDAYWESFRAYVRAVRSTEAELYRGFVRSRVLEMGLDSETGAALSARAMERFHAAEDRREALYSDLLGLADEAQSLHELLAEREASIAYEPFTRQGLSRDPVIEAVPEDPELAEEIWRRLDGIFDRLDWIQGVRPVSTLRLQQSLLSELELPERER